MNKLGLALVICGAVAGVGESRAQTRSMTICEQTVIYNVAPPAADVPPEVRAFSGAWIGSWNNQLCSVLIIEDIERDGTARAKYVFGSNPDWYIYSPGTFALRGKITGKVASFRSRDAVIEYRFSGPDELAGTYISRRAPTTASFKRAAVAAQSAASPGDARHYLGDDEIRARVVGRAFTWSNGAKLNYRSDGIVTYVSADGQRGSARFNVENGKLCASAEGNPTKICFLYFSDAQGLSVVTAGGETRRMTETP